jgi:hypothetical protein
MKNDEDKKRHSNKIKTKMSARVMMINREEVKKRIENCDEEIMDYKKFKLMRIIGMKTTAKNDYTDWNISVCDLMIDIMNLYKQFFTAVYKRNWKLLKLIRAKLLLKCDAKMEYLEIGVENGYINEDEYIQMSNRLKEILEKQDNLINAVENGVF